MKIADVVCKEIEMIQNKYNEIINSDLIEETLKQGAEKASIISDKKLKKVQRRIGIDIF